MKVLLVGNYEPDGQESMLRFAKTLEAGLREAGIDVSLARPEQRFGPSTYGGREPSGAAKWFGYLDKYVVFPRRLRRLAADADVVHVCDHSNAMYLAHIGKRPRLITCNDMIAIRSAAGEFSHHRTRLTGRILQGWIRSALRLARRYACISAATRRDLIRLTGCEPEAASVVYMGQNHGYAPVAEIAEACEARRRGEPFDAAVFERHGLPSQPYLLHVGGPQWYKNRSGVLAIHAALERRLGDGAPRLVFIGPPLESQSARSEARGNVSNEALTALYSGAELLLFPSLEEGFGWPVIEAQACGCRVVTTGKAPLTEVGGDAAIYLDDPHDAETGATRVAEVLAQDTATRSKLIAQGITNAARFSTADMIRQYADLYREVLGQ
jgi:glycosyltransferase involved in cell wall biosynthesis